MAANFPQGNLLIVGEDTSPGLTEQRVLIVGQKIGGTATSGELIENISNAGAENDLFGEDSMIAAMIRTFKLNNTVTRLDAIGLDDDGMGTAAEFTITVSTFTATVDAQFTLLIGSYRNSYTISVAAGNNQDAVATAIETAVNADARALVTANAVSAVVTFTAKNAGAVGNDIAFELSSNKSEFTFDLAQTVIGSTNPNLVGVFDAIGQERYQVIAWQTGFEIDEVKTLLDDRFNSPVSTLDGYAVQGSRETLSNLLVFLNSQDDKVISYIVNVDEPNDEFTGTPTDRPQIFELSSALASSYAALWSRRLTDGANITDLVVNAGTSRDGTGGSALASLPFANTPFVHLPLIKIDEELTQDEANQLRDAGGIVLDNNRGRTNIVAREAVTTYKTDPITGDPDPSFQFWNYVFTDSIIREYIYTQTKTEFSQTRLTTGPLFAGRFQITEQSYRAAFLSYIADLQGEDFVLVRGGQDVIEFIANTLVINIDFASGNLNVSAQIPIVTQLRSITGVLQFKLNIDL